MHLGIIERKLENVCLKMSFKILLAERYVIHKSIKTT